MSNRPQHPRALALIVTMAGVGACAEPTRGPNEPLAVASEAGDPGAPESDAGCADPGLPDAGDGHGAGDAVALEPVPGQPAADGWIWVGSHLHTSPGGSESWSRGVEHLLSWAEDHGITFQIITDHNCIDAWFMDTYAAHGSAAPIHGEEWTSSAGHATLLDFAAASAADAILPCNVRDVDPCDDARTDYAPMIAQVHERGGLVIINHPVLSTSAWDAEPNGADGVEVGSTATDLSARGAIDWWVSTLETELASELEGEPARRLLTAWGGSDYHYMRPPPSPAEDSPTDLVHAPDASLAGVRAALLARHNQVVYEVHGPQVMIGVDTDGDRVFDDYEAGDRVEMPVGQPFAIQWRVLGASGDTLRVIETREWREEDLVAKEVTTTDVAVTSDDFVWVVRRARAADSVSFLRSELGSTAIVGRPRNISNPVFF